MTEPRWRRIAACLGWIGFGLAAGWAADLVGLPLPWLIGPLLASAAASVGGAEVRLPPRSRQAGQVVVFMAVGLYVTPEVARAMVDLAPWMALIALKLMVLGVLLGLALARIGRIDADTAFFCSMPGGVVEMSNLARIHGADSELVSAAQSLRLTLVVLILPTLFLLFGVAGDEAYAPAAIPIRVEWLAAMLFVAALLGWGAARLRITNAYVISGLMIGAIVAAGDLPLSGMWEPLTWLGQVLLGVALGARFRRDQLPLLRRVAPLFALVTLTALSLSSTLAAALSGPVGLSVPTLILALAPGGTAEMSITAKVLGLGAPMVTAFHMVRIASVVTLTSPVYRWTAGLRRRARVRATP